MTAAPQRTVPTVVVQTARSLPDHDSGWTTQPWVRAVSGSGGSGQLLGEWTLVQDFGMVKRQASSEFVSAGIAPDISRAGVVDDLVGLVVRLLKEDEDGLIDVDGTSYTDFWWGVIQQQTIEPDLAASTDTGGRVTWLAAGLACVLDGIHLTRGWVLQSPGVAVDPGFLPAFNHQSGGDRSSTGVTVNGSSVYVHEIANDSQGVPWLASHILDLLLVGAAQPTLAGGTAAYGWTWTYTDLDGCLAYEVNDLDLGGLTLLQAINTLVSTRRGLVWTLSVSGSSATIAVVSASPDEIIVGSGGDRYTLPASSRTATLDVTDEDVAPWLADLVIDQDESNTYDVIEVRGSKPWTGLTLTYPDNLDKGWNPASEPDWAAFPVLPTYEPVWRRFTLADDWDETSTEGLGLANTVATAASSASYGANGLTGGRSQTAAADMVPGYMHQAERMLPCSELFTGSAIGPRQAPVVVVYNGGGVYEDMSLVWRVEVQSEPFAVVVDDGKNGTELASRLSQTGAKLYVSVGMREHRPFAVSWQRDPAEFPRATPRVKVIQVDGCELWKVRSGTVTGANADNSDVVRGAIGSSVAAVGTEISARDNQAHINAILALARAWFAVPAYRVRWTDRGVLDTSDTYAPGTLLTSVTLGDRTYGTYSLITRRSWVQVMRNGVEMWDTVYETQRLLPELQVLL